MKINFSGHSLYSSSDSLSYVFTIQLYQMKRQVTLLSEDNSTKSNVCRTNSYSKIIMKS